MRFLLEPCNNTLSHVAKCLALREALEARGHEVFLAVSSQRAQFLDRIGVTRYEVLPDIQQADGGPSPSFAWFRAERVEFCVRAEVSLLRRLRPDVVLGVFRFTGPLSASLAGVPYDSLICGCMTPACSEVLGFAGDEPGAKVQADAITFFRRAGAQRIQSALSALRLNRVDDLWQLLTGRRTFLWDFPEFQPLDPAAGYHHVGPIRWAGWPQPQFDAARLDALRPPIAVVAFGTGCIPMPHAQQVITALRRMGHSVALALGGQPVPLGLDADCAPDELAAFEFLPVEHVLARAALVICHGGQGLIFEAMRQAVPVVVLPLQPEQAQNGRCVERLGCGQRLLRGKVFDGHPSSTRDDWLPRSSAALADELSRVLANKLHPAPLAHAAHLVQQHNGVETLARMLERST
jgi:UDP:flavonoid glycosyltransferase YjiC (YdhE family)